MNNEIKDKIPENVRFVLEDVNSNILLDYITNLQQAIKNTKDIADDMLFELNQENERLKEQLNQYENPDDMTLFYMWLDAKTKDKMKELQQENERLKDNQLKALNMLLVVYGGNDEYYVKTILKARNILQNGDDSE